MSYGLIFASDFEGSLCGAGPDVFAVWGWVVANTNEYSAVMINPAYLASMLGMEIERVEVAIAYLCQQHLTECGTFLYRRLKGGE